MCHSLYSAEKFFFLSDVGGDGVRIFRFSVGRG
jgi:hypothetical protein